MPALISLAFTTNITQQRRFIPFWQIKTTLEYTGYNYIPVSSRANGSYGIEMGLLLS